IPGTTLPMPAAPVNVVATPNNDIAVTVTWSETLPANGLPIQYYNIFRGTSPTGLTALANRLASPFIDAGASPNTTYYYAILALLHGINRSVNAEELLILSDDLDQRLPAII